MGQAYLLLQDFLIPNDSGPRRLKSAPLPLRRVRPLGLGGAIPGGVDKVTHGLQQFLAAHDGEEVAVVNEWGYAIKGVIRAYEAATEGIQWAVFYDGLVWGDTTAFFNLSTSPSGGSNLCPEMIVLVGQERSKWWFRHRT